MAIQAKVTGTDLTIRNLEKLGARFPRKVISQSARIAAKPVHKAAKARAPKRTGRLRRNIKIRALKKSRVSAGVVVRTGTRQEMNIEQRGRSYYPASMEYGWRPRGTGLKIPGRWYMRGAWTANRANVRKIFLREMIQRLNAEARALPKRAVT